MVWNNKGGVGKTFLTYTIATEYAIAHPERQVAVIDMCPQANVSEMILGGNGTGEKRLAEFASKGKTIAGYIKERYARSRRDRLGTEAGYFCRASRLNEAMPPNFHLLPGDVDLDICSGLIAYMGNAPERDAWRNSRKILDDIVGAFENAFDNTVVFIDCNPSFAVYTEMATVAARELIIPCTADNASIRGILNVFRLIYGVNAYKLLGVEQQIDDTFFTFSSLAQDKGFALPKVRMIVLNKSRSLDATATKAWQAHSAQIRTVMDQIHESFRDMFCGNVRELVYDVKDGNTLATIANHTGLPISVIKHGSYDVYGCETIANQTQIDALMVQLQSVVKALSENGAPLSASAGGVCDNLI